jgi:cytochrome c oxidase subunit 2
MSRARLLLLLTVAISGTSAAFAGIQSSLDPAGIQAARINHLWWYFFWVCAVVYVLVLLAVLFVSIARRLPSDLPALSPFELPKSTEHRIARVVTVLVGMTILILFTFLLSEFFTGRRLYARTDPNPLQIKVIGRQWFWQFDYSDPVTSNSLTAYNELHVPVGRDVLFTLQSNDVIHSFWVPNLHGKKDLVPGYPTTTWFRADKEGVFRGQCAEFCGAQHAHMRFVVVAEAESKFKQWYSDALSTAHSPDTDSRARGQQVFLSTTCAVCHMISGTDARATIGPDLSHIASRPFIGAGTLPNNRGNLAAWIVDPQHIKPGIKMPPNPLEPADLQALLDYLESLK